jgi:hypothetical protein
MLFAVNMVVGIPVYMASRDVYYRERASSMYRPFAYAAGYAVAEVPYIVVMTVIFVVPVSASESESASESVAV